jgi:hypothetical protein
MKTFETTRLHDIIVQPTGSHLQLYDLVDLL